MAGSFLAGLWKLLTSDSAAGSRPTELPERTSSLIERSRKAASESEIEQINIEADELLNTYLKAQVGGQIDSEHAMSLNLMINHLETAIERRSQALKLRPAGSA